MNCIFVDNYVPNNYLYLLKMTQMCYFIGFFYIEFLFTFKVRKYSKISQKAKIFLIYLSILQQYLCLIL